ncbi:hypothetical protein AB0B60_43320 [Streptomyces lincolnensis]|uniref:hypothetical protein n=1 Tax=Streptomyces lincolnensis TaxID=1915 RepID=UPI00082A7E91|nr:hypothetical protein [Streptomyces lincolnensis]
MDAQEHVGAGRLDHARLALDAADDLLAQALLTLRLLRLALCADKRPGNGEQLPRWCRSVTRRRARRPPATSLGAG